MIASAGVVAGIDVGFSQTRRSSAVCVLRWDKQRIDWSIKRYRATEAERWATYQDLLSGETLQVVAFDGPIRRNLDLINQYRIAERNLTRALQRKIGKPGQSNSPIGKSLNEETNRCARMVLSTVNVALSKHSSAIHDHCLVEAFPTSYLGLMIADPSSLVRGRKAKSDIFYEALANDGTLMRLFNFLLPGREITTDLSLVKNHDDRAALICATTALSVLNESYCAVGDHVNGWITLPPLGFIQPWARSLLEKNGEADGSYFRSGTAP
jgi:hypothetical protein